MIKDMGQNTQCGEGIHNAFFPSDYIYIYIFFLLVSYLYILN